METLVTSIVVEKGRACIRRTDGSLMDLGEWLNQNLVSPLNHEGFAEVEEAVYMENPQTLPSSDGRVAVIGIQVMLPTFPWKGKRTDGTIVE